MSIRKLLPRNAKLNEEQIRHHLAGNIYRCIGRHKIVRAMDALVAAGRGRDG